MSELLPCPFCGAEPMIEDHRTIWAVRCVCGACVIGERAAEPDGSEPDEHWERIRKTAFDAWNRRHTPPGWQTVPADKLQRLRDSISGDLYMGEEWELSAIDNMLAASPKP